MSDPNAPDEQVKEQPFTRFVAAMKEYQARIRGNGLEGIYYEPGAKELMSLRMCGLEQKRRNRPAAMEQ